MMSELDYDALQRLSDAATPGPWEADDNRPFSRELQGIFAPASKRYVLKVEFDKQPDNAADAEFIAASRSAIPALLDRVRELEAENSVLGRASFAAILASGEDTDGVTNWEGYFRALRYPSWIDHVHQNVTSLREERDRAEVESLTAEAERDAALSTIAKVRELHRREPARYFGTDLNPSRQYDCRCCGEGRAWPCPTIRALGSVPSTGEGSDGHD